MTTPQTPVAPTAAPTAAPDGGRALRPSGVVRFGRRSALLLVFSSVVGLIAFAWPLLVRPTGSASLAHADDAPWVFLVLMPLLVAIVLAELSEGGIDSKAVAVLGVLTACGSALRIPGGAVSGFSPMFFLLLPAARVFGRGFGFVLGALTMFTSALLTGGVGPWLPYQMLATAWVGFGAGCLPRGRGWLELTWLAVYGFFAGLLYGFVMNLWFWPFATSAGAGITFVPGDPVLENLRRLWGFTVASSLGWDLTRSVGNVLLVVVAGRPVLNVLRRAARRASFGAVARFDPA